MRPPVLEFSTGSGQSRDADRGIAARKARRIAAAVRPYPRDPRTAERGLDGPPSDGGRPGDPSLGRLFPSGAVPSRPSGAGAAGARGPALRRGSAGLTLLALVVLAPARPSIRSQDDLTAKLQALPGVTSVTSANGTYDVTFAQLVDHARPQGAKFSQHVFLRHAGFGKPVLLGTEGYAARGAQGGELAAMLGGPNLITVEHRYFGRSIPEPLDWKALTVRNAADDMHAIVAAMKRLYAGKWVATGASKGGQTALFFKCFYPNDVDATVAYVAPVNVAQEDPRINRFIETVGDDATRARIKAFQIALLKREDEVLPLLDAKPEAFSMGVAKAYEYGVLEYPYAFWQYGSKPESIPAPDASAKALADEYRRVNTMFYYGDAGIRRFGAFIYQAFSEIGYYNYDVADFKPYLKANPTPTNLDIAPPGTKDAIVYDPRTMAFVFHELQYKADRVVYIYGETDAWSATQMSLIGRTDAIKIVAKDASHNASVRAMDPAQKELFYTTMERWLGLRLVRG